MQWGYIPVEYAWFFRSQYFEAGLILLASLVIAQAFQTTFVNALKKLTEKTETDIDDIIVQIASRPLFYLILVGGLFLSLNQLTVLNPYRGMIDGSFYVLIVLIVSWMVSRVFALLTTRWFQAKANVQGSPRLLNIIAGVIIYIFAIIIVLSHFQVEITPFVAALGVGGLAVGLALQDTLSNVFAGLHIISDEPVRVHDMVEIQGENIVGVVHDIGWRSTRIRTMRNNIVIIPNSKLANSVITNYHMPEHSLRTPVECGVDYSQDLERVERIAIEVASQVQKEIAGANKSHQPTVRFHTFADSNVNFRIWLGISRYEDKFRIEHEFIKRLHTRFAKEGIEISWPVRKVYHMGAPPQAPAPATPEPEPSAQRRMPAKDGGPA